MGQAMDDLSKARENMVESQVRPNDVTDLRIQHAMRTIPRELFIPKSLSSLAYSEEPLEVAPGRVALEPRTLAKLIHAANIKSTDLVLLVGTGTGYTAAILSYLAAAVVTLEEDASLSETANANFARLGIDTVATVTGSLKDGHDAQAPYDVIIINGGAEEIPVALTNQLATDGRLISIVSDRPVDQAGIAMGKARLYEHKSGGVSSRFLFDASAQVLPGFEKAHNFAL